MKVTLKGLLAWASGLGTSVQNTFAFSLSSKDPAKTRSELSIAGCTAKDTFPYTGDRSGPPVSQPVFLLHSAGGLQQLHVRFWASQAGQKGYERESDIQYDTTVH